MFALPDTAPLPPAAKWASSAGPGVLTAGLAPVVVFTQSDATPKAPLPTRHVYVLTGKARSRSEPVRSQATTERATGNGTCDRESDSERSKSAGSGPSARYTAGPALASRRGRDISGPSRNNAGVSVFWRVNVCTQRVHSDLPKLGASDARPTTEIPAEPRPASPDVVRHRGRAAAAVGARCQTQDRPVAAHARQGGSPAAPTWRDR